MADSLPGRTVPPCQFFGYSRLKIDDKGRMTLPAEHRKAMPEGSELAFVVRRSGDDPFLQLIPADEWRAVSIQRMGQAQATGTDLKRQQRTLNALVVEAPLDPKGRIVIAKDRLASIGVSDGAIVAGVGRILELWEPDAFLAEMDQHATDPADVDDLLYG